jgi:hypothetical protein
MTPLGAVLGNALNLPSLTLMQYKASKFDLDAPDNITLRK